LKEQLQQAADQTDGASGKFVEIFSLIAGNNLKKRMETPSDNGFRTTRTGNRNRVTGVKSGTKSNVLNAFDMARPKKRGPLYTAWLRRARWSAGGARLCAHHQPQQLRHPRVPGHSITVAFRHLLRLVFPDTAALHGSALMRPNRPIAGNVVAILAKNVEIGPCWLVAFVFHP
jgi:hypothetical protein